MGSVVTHALRAIGKQNAWYAKAFHRTQRERCFAREVVNFFVECHLLHQRTGALLVGFGYCHSLYRRESSGT